MSNDWLTALKNSPVAKLNPHLLGSDAKPAATKIQQSAKNLKQVRWMREQLTWWCRENGVALLTEHKFNEFRKYKFDFAIAEYMLAIEYEGGIFMERGGHNSPTGIQRDVDKYNLAQSEGWKVIRFHVKNYKTVLQEVEKQIRDKSQQNGEDSH